MAENVKGHVDEEAVLKGIKKRAIFFLFSVRETKRKSLKSALQRVIYLCLS